MKIEVFLRHCHTSKVNISSKNRPGWWDKQKVFENFKRTVNSQTTNYTVIYDKHYGEKTFSYNNVYEINCGKESSSFCEMLDYVVSQDLNDETIIYFLEDDYVHKPEWDRILIDGFSLFADYVTLYDHGDKYCEVYKDFRTKILVTNLSHWMPTPSTTNTFATKFKTLKEDIEIHRYFSTGFEPSADHAKFLELNRRGRNLISCIPGYSTHCHTEFLSPCIKWEEYL